ncbi:MAG TPA: M64 family metallopeptidase, partial [Solirubrobacter sp.]|nr:M64 family metallopeptidase [Solirubrobacter sp.]
ELPPNRVVPLQVTGPPEERLNLIVVGDGYTAGEMQKFRDNVDKHLNIQWSFEPFKSYRNYFNVYMIEVESPVSGISCDPDDGDVPRDTPLHLGFSRNCATRPTDPNARGITYGSGGQDVLDALVAQIPGVTEDNRQTLALANTFTYGGIGGRNATTSGSSPQGPLISPHELGHSLGGLQDEYPYSTRGVPGRPYTGGEPSSIHHTILTAEEMLAGHLKWWRWLGEESLSGGPIGLYESGQTRASGIWRPSEHSMMRWLGNYFDQVSRERMTERMSGRRDADDMTVVSRPVGTVGPNEVLWVETGHPKDHQLDVTWSVNGTDVPDTGNSRNFALASRGLAAGDVVRATVVDNTEFVRDPAVRDSPSMTQTREWTIGTDATPPADVTPAFTNSTPATHPVARDEVVFVETTHPTESVLPVTWKLDGEEVPNPANSRNFDLAAHSIDTGTHALTATVGAETRTWTVDNVMPTAPAELSEPLTTLPGAETHNVYFETFDMKLTPQDDEPGYVVGEFRLNHDGWFNYFGWPDAPEGTPYKFTPAGTEIKALIYGSLGTGGMSKAPFEQEYPDFVPGYKTHTVEHHAIDAAGNIGPASEFKATVLPGAEPDCTRTLTGAVDGSVVVSEGATCLDDATVGGDVIVRDGGSLVVTGGQINGRVDANGGQDVQLFGTEVLGSTRIADGEGNTTLANNLFSGGLTLDGNQETEFGLALVANTIYVGLSCNGSINDFGAANNLGGTKACEGIDTAPVEVLTSVDGDVGGAVPATLSLTLGAPASFGAFVPGVADTYTASTTANVISSAGDAALTVTDPSATATGHLVNGTFVLPQPLKVGGQALPATVKTYDAPISNDAVTIGFSQDIGAGDALRTGTYAKTLTFTLSTTQP